MSIKFKPVIPKRISARKLAELPRQFESIMGDFVTKCQDDLATYPPQKPHITRIRTKHLGQSWHHTIEAKGNAIIGTVASQGQIAPYNVYVQGPRAARWARPYGWKQPKDVLEKRWPKAVKAVQAAVKAAAR